MLHFWKDRSSRAEEDLAASSAGFSLARYEPMGRLLCEEDLLFLRAQPGYTAEIGRRFSRERRRLFRLYLRELSRDFQLLHAHARAVVASLAAENSPLVGLLLRQQVRFWYEMAAVELKLSLSWAGTGTVDARGLVDAVGIMHAEISRLAAPSIA